MASFISSSTQKLVFPKSLHLLMWLIFSHIPNTFFLRVHCSYRTWSFKKIFLGPDNASFTCADYQWLNCCSCYNFHRTWYLLAGDLSWSVIMTHRYNNISQTPHCTESAPYPDLIQKYFTNQISSELQELCIIIYCWCII